MQTNIAFICKRCFHQWLKSILLASLLFQFSCNKKTPVPVDKLAAEIVAVRQDTLKKPAPPPPYDTVILASDVKISRYFEFMDSLVKKYDTLVPYKISEHLIVRANPWIIDTLENTDYYRMMQRGIFVYDQRTITVLKKGDMLFIPNEETAEELKMEQDSTVLDLNIPEFKLRIFNGEDTLYTFPVRIGLNKTRYLAMSGRETDLRTAPGVGSIVRINKDPKYINPEDNEPYLVTNRDDGKVTLPPRIPWLEPSLDGQRLGQMIHATTNPKSLGKPYSNGCVGVKEADAWRIYYYAPIGTKVVFRYDLDIVNPQGDTVRLKDVYGMRKRKARNQL